MKRILLATLMFFVLLTVARGGKPNQVAAPTDASLRAAVEKSLPLLAAGARGSREKRAQCFTCHSQGLTMLALSAAKARGFKVDEEELGRQIKFTVDFLATNQKQYLVGKGQGGQIDTAGYALWALDVAGEKPDATTGAVAEYFLRWQSELDYWRPTSRRPPTQQSLFTSSYLALYGLKVFGTPEQKERREQRFAQVRSWLLKTPAQDNEDRVFRLRALQVVDAPEAELRKAAQELLQKQKPDGGWAQNSTMETDVYATATALVALNEVGGLATTDAAYRKGLRYLLEKQLPDGSWHVVTRSVPIQTYFESGYPHGKDQFISVSAAAWATTALARALPLPAHTNVGGSPGGR